MKAATADAGKVSFRVSKLERETLHERAYLELRKAIMSGAIPPGATITIRAMATALGTSPMPVREALRRLEASHVLELRGGGVLAVPAPSPDELQEIREIRVSLEGLAA